MECPVLQSSPEKGQFSGDLLRNPNSPEISGDFTRFADVFIDRQLYYIHVKLVMLEVTSTRILVILSY
jgi:hypothetical protein